ncbi:alanine racemase C-terminal domain-containing protein [Rhodococcus aetherivorans]
MAERDCSVALLPVGHADGSSRALGRCMPVLLGGWWRPRIGLVCMDRIVVYLGTDTDVTEGDRAVLFEDLRAPPGAHRWARAFGTTPAEILGGLRSRIEWRYIIGAQHISGSERRGCAVHRADGTAHPRKLS